MIIYIKKLQKTIIAVLVSAIISTIASIWIFNLDWKFFPFPFLAGLAITFIQKENTAYKFISQLFVGSLIYGFLTLLLIYAWMYLFLPDFPFWPFYNPKEYLIFSLVFSFICLLGGLTGIIIKGGYSILKNRKHY